MKYHRRRTLAVCAIIVLTEASAFCGTAEFQPTVPNKHSPAGKAPQGMVWVPGGEFSMGAAVAGEGSHAMPMASNDSQPVHRVYVDAHRCERYNIWWRAHTPTSEFLSRLARASRAGARKFNGQISSGRRLTCRCSRQARDLRKSLGFPPIELLVHASR